MLCERAEEMLRQVKTLQSDTKKAEARLRAVRRALEETEKNASRLHRKLQGVSAWNPLVPLPRRRCLITCDIITYLRATRPTLLASYC